MKLLMLAGLAAPAFVVSALAVAAPMSSNPGALRGGITSGAGVTPSIPYHSHDLEKRRAILVVRAEGMKLQAADGGKLTEAHRAYLQAKLDAVLAGNY